MPDPGVAVAPEKPCYKTLPTDPSGGKHGEPVRGLKRLQRGDDCLPPSPVQYGGRYGHLFPDLPAADFDLKLLGKLGRYMTSIAPDPPKDGRELEESGVPALYTYLGQFIDHDITFDPNSSFEQRRDADAEFDYRTPFLDLDSVYGGGPSSQPYLYIDAPSKRGGAKHFVLGDRLYGGSDPNARDLPRNQAVPARAIIGDPRNDENAIVSQLHGLFLRFHNRLARQRPSCAFEEIQELVQHHYQYMVAYDFLPRIIHSKVLNRFIRQSDPKKGQYDSQAIRYFLRDMGKQQFPFMPVEFSVGAYRFGHSMVRSGYRLNDTILRPVFPMPPLHPEGLTGFKKMDPGWGIDWGRFIDIDERPDGKSDLETFRRLQFAYRIDTALANPLANLPLPAVVSNQPQCLAERNLLRGYDLCLPTGQAVAAKMVKDGTIEDSDVLTADKVVIGKAVNSEYEMNISEADKSFVGNCPLWTYILAEAMQNREPEPQAGGVGVPVDTPKLGPVGGRIVAEVILGLLFADSRSVLNCPDWKPTAFHDPWKTKEEYTLADFVQFASCG